ncbi:hypothetical protein MASR2M79_23830 [Aminivibrio sp.]
MKLTVVGTGYVGLVTGVCLAKFGNDVVCVDTNAEKIESLSRGEVPFYEPGLEEIIGNNLEAGRLSFSTDLPSSLKDATICFITVGTPSLEGGGGDLCAVEAVARTIGQSMEEYKLVVVKSTVPVNTCESVRKAVAEELENGGGHPLRRGLQSGISPGGGGRTGFSRARPGRRGGGLRRVRRDHEGALQLSP